MLANSFGSTITLRPFSGSKALDADDLHVCVGLVGAVDDNQQGGDALDVAAGCQASSVDAADALYALGQRHDVTLGVIVVGRDDDVAFDGLAQVEQLVSPEVLDRATPPRLG